MYTAVFQLCAMPTWYDTALELQRSCVRIPPEQSACDCFFLQISGQYCVYSANTDIAGGVNKQNKDVFSRTKEFPDTELTDKLV